MKHAIIIVCFLMVFCSGCTTSSQDHASIIFFIGDVKKNNTQPNIGDKVSANDIISTGKHSSCDIKIGDSIIRVKEKSKLRVSELSHLNNIEKTTVGLDIGKMLCKTKRLLKKESFTVKTPTSVAGVRGTKFSVESDTKKTARIKGSIKKAMTEKDTT